MAGEPPSPPLLLLLPSPLPLLLSPPPPSCSRASASSGVTKDYEPPVCRPRYAWRHAWPPSVEEPPEGRQEYRKPRPCGQSRETAAVRAGTPHAAPGERPPHGRTVGFSQHSGACLAKEDGRRERRRGRPQWSRASHAYTKYIYPEHYACGHARQPPETSASNMAYSHQTRIAKQGENMQAQREVQRCCRHHSSSGGSVKRRYTRKSHTAQWKIRSRDSTVPMSPELFQ